MPERCKILYLGLPLGALLLLRDGHDVTLACVSRTGAPGMRRLRRAMAERGGLVLGRPDLTAPGVMEVLESAKPDLIVSWFWTRRVPADVLRLAPHAFGVHPSLLPRHRGPDPYYWALARGDRETGVTAHVLSPEYDKGEIIAQRTVPVPDDCDSMQLAHLLDRPSLALLREITGKYSRGERLPTRPQDESKATLAPAPADDDCELRWDWTVDEVLRRVRAGAPEPGAFTGYGDETVVITRARRAQKTPKVLEPGDVALSDEGVLIRAADGAIVVLEARREGDEAAARGEAVRELFPGVPRV